MRESVRYRYTRETMSLSLTERKIETENASKITKYTRVLKNLKY